MTWLDRALVGLYRLGLHAYPREFRRAYGEEMAQVFQTALHARLIPPRMLLMRAAADLVASAVQERLAAMRLDIRALLVCIVAILLSGGAGYLHLRTDADATAALLVLTGGVLCGLLYPGKSLRWGLIVGIGVPLALVVGHSLARVPVPPHDPDTLSPLTLLPALLGAYAGSALGAIPRQAFEASRSR